MSGQTNIAQIDPSLSNIDSDSTYQGDSRTTGGFTSGQIVPSPWLNKFAYQMSTLLQGFAWWLAGLGATVNDGSSSPSEVSSVSTAVSTLATMFGNYLASQAWVQNGFAISLTANGYIKLPAWADGLMIQWFTMSSLNTGTYNFPTAFPNACLFIIGADGTSASSGSCGCNVVSATQFAVKVSTQTTFAFLAIGY